MACLNQCWNIGTRGTKFSEILGEIHTFSYRKTHLKMSSGKCEPLYNYLNVLGGISGMSVSGSSVTVLTMWSCVFILMLCLQLSPQLRCAIFFVDGYFISISLRCIRWRTFCFADTIIVNVAQMVGVSCAGLFMYRVTLLFFSYVENKVFRNPESSHLL